MGERTGERLYGAGPQDAEDAGAGPRPPGRGHAGPRPRAVDDARVLVAGPSRVSSAGLGSLLRGAGLNVVGEAPAIEHAPAVARRVRPDVILVELAREEPSALAAIRRIARSAPRANVVAIFGDRELDLVGAVEAGAYACVLKDAPMHEILATTRAAARGVYAFSALDGRTLGGRGARRAHAAELTEREVEVLELLARGWDNGRIAADLYMSRATVKRHISSILHKLQVENRIQAAVRAVEEGLLSHKSGP
jgi:DNA-binding NarL/FixJ family response regulator